MPVHEIYRRIKEPQRGTLCKPHYPIAIVLSTTQTNPIGYRSSHPLFSAEKTGVY